MANKAKRPRGIDQRRVVTYDLTDDEREAVKARAAADDRSVSVWVARVLRAELQRVSRNETDHPKIVPCHGL